MRVFLTFLMCALIFSGAMARTSYTGYSGAPGSRGTCAASCHGPGSGTVSVTDFPSQYSPGQAYLITISRPSGSTINNFNASCRIGTGSTNAGAITAGTGTAVYNVTGETNGVHLSSANQASATFNWTAPAAGTGSVRLYVGAHQGSYSGSNTTLVLVSNEAAPPPAPTNLAIGRLIPHLRLRWLPADSALTYNVYRDIVPDVSTTPDRLIGTTTGTTFVDSFAVERSETKLFYVVTSVAGL